MPQPTAFFRDLALPSTGAPAVMAPWSPAPPPRTAARHHRTIFLSDLHLGAGMAQPEALLAFLDQNSAETYYLVGDVVDHWQPLGLNWGPAHHAAVRRLLALPQSGARVIYIPGNHDAFFRHYAGQHVGGITVAMDTVHVTAAGARLLVVHGDCCDVFARRAPLLARLGTLIEAGARGVDAVQRRTSQAFGLGAWEGIDRSIARVNGAIRRFDGFERRLARLAVARGLDGVVCGHFHQPALTTVMDVTYANCGDWAGSNSAVLEAFDGRLSLHRMPARGTPETVAQPDLPCPA